VKRGVHLYGTSNSNFWSYKIEEEKEGRIVFVLKGDLMVESKSLHLKD
jgi:hypothetical protein